MAIKNSIMKKWYPVIGRPPANLTSHPFSIRQHGSFAAQPSLPSI
jgi:hypothetical protein